MRKLLRSRDGGRGNGIWNDGRHSNPRMEEPIHVMTDQPCFRWARVN